jgi:hypothetical protein
MSPNKAFGPFLFLFNRFFSSFYQPFVIFDVFFSIADERAGDLVVVLDRYRVKGCQ